MLQLHSDDAVEQTDTLLHNAYQSIRGCYDAPAYGPISNDDRPVSDDVRGILLRQGMKLLHALRTQVTSP